MEKTPVWRTEYLEGRHTGVCGDPSRASGQAKCIDGKPCYRLRVRAVNDGYILEELGKALANWGKRLAGKWWGSTGSPTENLYLDKSLNSLHHFSASFERVVGPSTGSG